MKEKLEKLREKRFLELKHWAGLSNMPGISGLIITDDKKIYYYNRYNRVPEYLEKEVALEHISEGKALSEAVYFKLVDYINTKIAGRSFEDIMMRDAGYTIIGKDFSIINHFDIYDELKKIIGG